VRLIRFRNQRFDSSSSLMSFNPKPLKPRKPNEKRFVEDKNIVYEVFLTAHM
jgi:hypothetical protein